MTRIRWLDLEEAMTWLFMMTATINLKAIPILVIHINCLKVCFMILIKPSPFCAVFTISLSKILRFIKSFEDCLVFIIYLFF